MADDGERTAETPESSPESLDGERPAAVVVTLNAPPALEERLVDWLLERNGSGFTTYAAHGHSTRPGRRLSVAEQVTGRERRVEFRVEIPAAALDDFLGELRQVGHGADLYYSVTPLLSSGYLGDPDR